MNGIESVIGNTVGQANNYAINYDATQNLENQNNGILNNNLQTGGAVPSNNTLAAVNNNSNSAGSVRNNNSAGGNQKKLTAQILQQIQKELNPSPMLPTVYMLSWDGKYGGVVLNVIDNKTGEVIGTVPPSQVLKYLKNYYKGMFYNNKS
ncbi:MAG: flagellar protein FlaG [Deltaproteobacteria bacterium]|nr:flagellar protein FlaG [Deltaproteobacteria bacterium]MCL5880342.1 flagellar protein FlaG [Deltaproteobacteria bacterium]MDA8303619.1 flagellar protein FlaG [Deltaproteobacteria bacterium]